MKAGRNTPETVLRYIDAIWAKEEGPDPVAVAARRLGWSEARLERERLKSVQTHGTALGEVVLRNWLKASWEESADRCIQLGKTDGYEVTMLESLDDKTPVPFHGQTVGAWDGAPEPECVRPEVLALIVERSTQVSEVVNAEDIAKKEARSRAERLRQAEIELRRAGGSPEHFVQNVEATIEAMRQAARGTLLAA